ncbi:hypothetical protein V6N12_007623 [Hibiscus sabdariffa]|uniref:Uncharacterized protein n=1 Tax=Hibiscus sabdariffa TaxID=183260 RepID=A0ABR2F2B1_9ROSI
MPQRPFVADPLVSDISNAPFVGSDVILKDGYLRGGDNGLDEFRGDGPKLVNHVIAKGGDYKVLEVDVPEFSSREELAVGVTPLNGEALRRQRWFQFLGFRAWTVVLISLVMIRRLMELKLLSCWLQNRLQRLILTPERKADVARGSLLGKDDFGTELNDLKEDAG